MRAFASLLLPIVLTACGGPGAPPGDPPPAVPHELTLPVQYAASTQVLISAKFDAAWATAATELSYGLTDGYPRQGTISVQGGYVLFPGCQANLGAVVWRSLGQVQGTAAKLDLVGGKLAVDLREEGTVSALLEGEITDQHCVVGSDPAVTVVPLRHRVTLQVHRVAGFVVDQFHQQLGNCWGPMVLPSGALLWAPAAHPLDAAGQRFEPVNAPTPATITLRSDGALLPGADPGRLSAGAGTVALSVDTGLPVQGLGSFAVVDPAALTSVQAALYLRKAATKGNVTERIEEGSSYQLFFPEQANAVDILVDSAMTARGKLCANVPGAWFATTSATPAQCAASASAAAEFPANPIPVAAIGALGECRLAVTIPGTSLSWAARFSTTR